MSVNYDAFFRDRQQDPEWRENHPCLYMETPVGMIRIEEDAYGISSLSFVGNCDISGVIAGEKPCGLYLNDAKMQLREYFEGKRKAFTLPLSASGSPFQKRVWSALGDIPYGETRSYQQIAAAVGDKNAARAVGMANHRNPIVIMIPCHRVIGKSGALVGYGGGIERKRFLLALEAERKG